MKDFPYTYAWHRCDRKGQRCRVFARSRRMNSVGLEFEDGFKMVTSANALRRVKETAPLNNDHEDDCA